MKKVTLLITIVFAVVLMSCKKDHKHGPETHEHQEHADQEAKDLALADVYACPMDCEKGKTYDEEGTCPVCKMKLNKVEQEKADHDENHNEDHDTKKNHTHDGEDGHNH